MKKENKKYFVTAAIAIASIIVIFIAVIVKKTNNQKRFDEQMNLGNRYLSEENYEAAVIAFNKAIEIDPRNVESYSKAAQAYIGMGDYEGAIQILEKGIMNTGDEGLKQEKENYEQYYHFLPILKKLADFFQKEDRTSVWNYMSGDEYHDAILNLKQRLEYQDENGKYLLIYPCGHSYYGNMEEGQRSGYGIWASYRYNWGVGDFFQGEWKDDYPNGMGTYSWIFLDDNTSKIIEGNYKDGYEDGDMVEVYTDSSGKDMISHRHSDNGVPGITSWEIEGGAHGTSTPIMSDTGIIHKEGISHTFKDDDTSMSSHSAKEMYPPFY